MSTRKGRGRFRVMGLLLAFGTAALAAGFVSRAPLTTAPGRAEAAPVAAPKKSTTALCRTDADCTLVPDDCCPCSGGGRQRAILVKEKDAYERARKERCAGTMCAAVMSTDPSCAATKAVCKSGACALGGPPPPSAGAGGGG